MRRSLAAAALALAMVFGLSGCQTLAPWERGQLQRPCMEPSTDPLAAGFEQHVHTQREGMAGASSTTGVSCGCN